MVAGVGLFLRDLYLVVRKLVDWSAGFIWKILELFYRKTFPFCEQILLRHSNRCSEDKKDERNIDREAELMKFQRGYRDSIWNW